MNIFDVLYARQTGKTRPRAKITDNLLGLALAGGGYEEKTVDFTPVISVSDAKAGNALDYQCKITAKQTGTGDPSPQNIRSIDGWTGANISVNGSTVAVSWQTEAGTVYGGTLDVTTGTLTVTHTAEVYDGTEEGWTELSGGLGYYLRITGGSDYTRNRLLISSHLKGVYSGSSASMPLNSIMLNANKTNLLCRVDTETDFPSIDDWKDFIAQNPMTVLFPLATPITYTITPTEITLSEGANTIWADCGDSKMTYLAKK